jgi:hypothetical protein
MFTAIELLPMAFSGGESEPERDLTEASYGARNWLVSVANTLKKDNKAITLPNSLMESMSPFTRDSTTCKKLVNILYPTVNLKFGSVPVSPNFTSILRK